VSAAQQARNRALVQENAVLRGELERAKALCLQLARERDEARVAWCGEYEAHLLEEGMGDPWAAVRGQHAADLLAGDAAVEASIYRARWGVPIPADLALQRAADEWAARQGEPEGKG
jgi:hypothetical protein